MRRSLLTPLLVLLPALSATEAEIRKAEQGWVAAVVKNDFAALDRILGDQLIYAHSTGVIETKAEYLGRLRKGAQKYDAIEHQQLTIRVYGDSAVAHAKVRMAGQSDTRAFDDRLMMMHLWVKQGGAWRLVAHQTTRLQ
jgi:ketosteroid isomerase-like protein